MLLNRRSNVPVDRGWAWVVCFGVLGVFFCMNALVKCFGVLLLDFQYKYQTPTWMITIVQGTYISLWSALALVSNALAARFTCRAVIVAGGAVAAVGFVGASFADTWPLFFLTHGIILGIGYGLVYGPCVVVLASYFDKKRALAMGIAQSGVGIGNVVMPSVVRFFETEYGINGAVLLQGALVIQVCVFAMVFRPLWFYERHAAVAERDMIALEISENVKYSLNENVKIHYETEADKIVLNEKQCVNTNDNNNKHNIEEHFNNDLKIPADLQNEDQSVMDTTNKGEGDTLIGNKPKSKSDVETEIVQNVDCQKTLSGFRKYVDVTLCCDVRFMMYTICVITADVAYINTAMILPPHAVVNHFTVHQAGLFSSMFGGADFIGRLFAGWFSDLGYFPRCYIFGVLVVLAGVSTILVQYATSYIALTIGSLWCGFVYGAGILLTYVVVVDVAGVDRAGSAIGIPLFLESIVTVVAAQIVGVLNDVTGSWNASFWFSGCFALVGGLIATLDLVRYIYQKKL